VGDYKNSLCWVCSKLTTCDIVDLKPWHRDCDMFVMRQNSDREYSDIVENAPCDGRPSFDEIYMHMAMTLARRSTCSRRRVGCVITSSCYRYVYGVGYNGNASGMSDKCDRPEEQSNCGCLHAEENAVINCQIGRDVEKYVYTTVFPCVMCAKRLVNLGGVSRIFYKSKYHNQDSLEILSAANIVVVHQAGSPQSENVFNFHG
jgi:dCMP deaminase